MKRDDGAILYLNGREIGRSNMPTGTVTSGTLASATQSGSNESSIHTIDYPLSPGDLTEGENILAVEVHQSSTGSGDLGLDVRLSGFKPTGPPAPVTLTRTGTVRSRIFHGSEWSALTEASFIVGTPASPGNLAVTGIMYNPIGASEDSEYIELMNISPTGSIDLTDVHFVAGITYQFPAGFVLAPLQRVVIARNEAVFAETYPSEGITVAPGFFSGSLSNSGEEIALRGQDDRDIRRFTYGNSLPWPPSPDGLGFSLVLSAPTSNPDHSIAANWRASVALGGSPGEDDSASFAGDPGIDADQDGRSAFFEFATGTSDANPVENPVIALGLTSLNDGGAGLRNHLDISFRRNLAADEALYHVEISTDLQNWNSLEVHLVSIENHGDGTATYTYRSEFPMGARNREFLRLQVIRR